jgi:hypothetical protein
MHTEEYHRITSVQPALAGVIICLLHWDLQSAFALSTVGAAEVSPVRKGREN